MSDENNAEDNGKVIEPNVLPTNGEREWETGEAFKFLPYEFNDQHVGHIEEGVVMILSPDDGAGVVMSADDAEALGVALIQAAATKRLDDEGRLADHEDASAVEPTDSE